MEEYDHNPPKITRNMMNDKAGTSLLYTAGPRWLRLAQDRDKWLSLEEAFTCERVLAEQPYI